MRQRAALTTVLALAPLPVAAQLLPPGFDPSQVRQPPRGSSLPPRSPLGAPRPGTPSNQPPKPRDTRLFPEADQVSWADGKVVARGHVRFTYDGYIVTCDRATYDEKTQIAIFESQVRMDTGKEVFTADRITFNRKTNEFSAIQARTILSPERVGPSLLQPLSLWGAKVRREGQILYAEDGFLTTCDLPNPHAKIGFRRAELIPKKRVTLRDATLYRYDRPVARIKHLTIPITDDVHYSYLPTIGRTNEEGYFLKAAIGYSLTRMLPGLLRVDLMQKKGIGLGADQVYRVADRAAGRVNFYTLNDKSRGTRNFNGRIEHEQRLGEIDARLQSDFQNNSYLAATANSKTQNTSLTLTRNSPTGATSVNVGLNGSQSGGSTSQTTSYGLSQGFRLGRSGNLDVRFTGSENESAFGATQVNRIQQTGELRASGQLGVFQASLAANKNLKNSQSGSATSTFFAGTEKLPELTLTTSRFHGPLKGILSNLTLGYGQFLEGTTTNGVAGRLNTNRFLFQSSLTPQDRPLTANGRLRLRVNGDFRQTIYDGGTAAQYVLTEYTTLSQQVSAKGSFNVSYNYVRPYGGTPVGFRQDLTSPTNLLTTDYRVTGGHAALSLGAGYDIIQAKSKPLFSSRRTPWNQLRFTSEWKPTANHYTKLVGSYDVNTGKLTDLTDYASIRLRQRLALDTSTRYDPRLKKLRDVRAILATPLFDNDTRIIANSSYNNVTRRFDYNTLALTRAFHDYELTVSYVDQPFGFRSEKGVNLSIRLKAFPSPQTYGGGRYGTPLDTGLGSF